MIFSAYETGSGKLYILSFLVSFNLAGGGLDHRLVGGYYAEHLLVDRKLFIDCVDVLFNVLVDGLGIRETAASFHIFFVVYDFGADGGRVSGL